MKIKKGVKWVQMHVYWKPAFIGKIFISRFISDKLQSISQRLVVQSDLLIDGISILWF